MTSAVTEVKTSDEVIASLLREIAESESNANDEVEPGTNSEKLNESLKLLVNHEHRLVELIDLAKVCLLRTS